MMMVPLPIEDLDHQYRMEVEGNIVKMKKKVIFGIVAVLVIGLGILCGFYLYNNVSADTINELWLTAVQ